MLFTSCASILNSSYKEVTVHTTKPSEIVYAQDTMHTHNNQVSLTVKRQDKSLSFQVLTDSLTKKIHIPPKNSAWYGSNIFFNYGIGMLVDKNNPKRFSYPNRIYIISEDPVNRYFKYNPITNQGRLQLHFSLPHINLYSLLPENERRKGSTGFLGLSFGLDYYRKDRQFISAKISGVTNVIVPFPAAIDLEGEHEFFNALAFSISNNHQIKRWSLGYGLAFSKLTWDLENFDSFDPIPPTRDPIKLSHHAIGLVFPTYYQFGQNFYLGLIYRPSFIRPQLTNVIKYEHVISIDFAWKWRL